jgi:hypothetical protein
MIVYYLVLFGYVSIPMFFPDVYDVLPDDPVRSRPMPPGYAHEPPDAGTRARPGLAVGVLQG